ncbi:MAG: YchJ family metal-binding protein [Gammaproteobacteria bacterium]|nr:YchJ family metal-binding protein [Gammaproteobacteria bacterium]
MKCPCGSKLDLADCCQPFLEGSALPASAEQLMRSRYTAFTLQRMDYVDATWHADFRPADPGKGDSPRWLELAVIDSKPGTRSAQVEFEARYLAGGRVNAVHERSSFCFEQDRWWYTQGEQLPPTFVPWKPARNEACPCGSGAKFKRCCGRGS